MDIEYISTASMVNQVVDCRYLSLAFEFYQLNREQVLALIHEAIQWVENKLDTAFVRVYSEDRKSVTLEKALVSLENSTIKRHGWSLVMDAMCISHLVYNKQTLRKYTSALRRGAIGPEKPIIGISQDFPAYWDNLSVSRKEDPELVKKKFLTLFNEPGKYCLSHPLTPDADLLVTAVPYYSNSALFFGSFCFSISHFCLNGNTECIANEMARFSKHLSDTYRNLNVRVLLQPKTTAKNASQYLSIFGDTGPTDDSHIDAGCFPHEWYSTYYLQGAEWFNIVSPLAGKHLSDPFEDTLDCVTEKYADGRVTVQSKKQIDWFDVSDAKQIKQAVYPALFPGQHATPLRIMVGYADQKPRLEIIPRRNWAVVPVFDWEVDIIGDYLALSHSLDR